jgi:hypothetical protein
MHWYLFMGFKFLMLGGMALLCILVGLTLHSIRSNRREQKHAHEVIHKKIQVTHDKIVELEIRVGVIEKEKA